MSYEALEPFKDREDNNYFYKKAGEEYPREGHVPSEERIQELASDQNRKGRALIVKKDGTAQTRQQNDDNENTDVNTEDEDVSVNDVPADDEHKTLDDYTNDELKEFLDELGVEYKVKTTKPQLIEMLKEALKED